MDPGMEVEEQWLCLCSDGRWVRFTNSDVRGCTNFTLGRNKPEKPEQWKHFKPVVRALSREDMEALVRTPGALLNVDEHLAPIPKYEPYGRVG